MELSSFGRHSVETGRSDVVRCQPASAGWSRRCPQCTGAERCTCRPVASRATGGGAWARARCRNNNGCAAWPGAKRVLGVTARRSPTGGPPSYQNRRAVWPQLRPDACRLSPSETRETTLPTGSRRRFVPAGDRWPRCRLRSMPRRTAVPAYVQPFLTSRPLGPVHPALPSEVACVVDGCAVATPADAFDQSAEANSVTSASVAHRTRLETRTKESSLCASH
ncbi:hypothetical protein M514_27837 [Trichuris suis]|uniref:Uncharacterized protein n=1 Tax=Trichuris suis TaxID=68888 RepID=A0A085MRZ3_9BILA|nr:hypothetical protein M514_27837 [Trichuris suis]